MESREVFRQRLAYEGRLEGFARKLSALQEGGKSLDESWAELEPHYAPLREDELPRARRKDLTEGRKDPGAKAPAKVRKKAASEKKVKGKLDVRKLVEWVFANMAVKGNPADAEPCPGALEFLRSVQKNPTAKAKFYSEFLVKLLPSRSQLEMSDRFRDQGQNVLDTLDRIEALDADNEESEV